MANARSKSASSRSFGLIIGLAFAAIGVWKYESGAWRHFIWIAIGAVFLLLAILMPRLLRPAKALWLRLGQLLGRFLSPVVLTAVYVFSIVPIGLLLKLFGKDSLRRADDPKSESYWIARNTPGPDPASLKNQF
jgi:RsiW-degrading membrane proteinase PrsW (M82 family)